MSTYFARGRGKEAPMVGIEFTNRAKTVPAWRVSGSDAHDKENENASNPALKRSHDTALPPPAPFDPKKNGAEVPQPVFGENLRYLFKPPPVSSAPWAAGPSTAVTMEIPEVDMKDVELSPPRPHVYPQRSLGQANGALGQADVGGDERDEIEERMDRRKEDESPERRRISNAAVRRIARRRQDARSRSRLTRLRGKSRAVDVEDEELSGEDEEEEEEDGSQRKGRALTRNTSNHFTLNMPGPAPVKTDTPYILLGYLQFMFNLSLILVFLYLLVQFIFTVQRDVEQRIGEYSAEILQEISTCAQLYKQNLCETSPIPAMLHQCATWETCMSRDPKVVGRAKVGAEMLAEVVNGFVEPISWKTLLFTLSSLAFMTIFVNGLVMLYRARLHPDRQQHPHPPPDPPQHQHQHQQQHLPLPLPNFAPFHTGYGYTPHPQMSWRPEPSNEVDGVPRQRRRLEIGESTIGSINAT